MRPLSDDVVERARRMRTSGASYEEIARALGVSTAGVRRRLTGKSSPRRTVFGEPLISAGYHDDVVVPPAHVVADRDRRFSRPITVEHDVLGSPPPGYVRAEMRVDEPNNFEPV